MRGTTNREKILVEISPDDLMLNITVRTELRGEQMSNLSWLVFAAVDSLVKEWYNLNVRRSGTLTLTAESRCLCSSVQL
jgi:hypothetical protein